MVFKGRFFSSKKSSDTSSPEGSNSPRSFGSSSSSPVRSEKKKAKPTASAPVKEDSYSPSSSSLSGLSSSFRKAQVKDGPMQPPSQPQKDVKRKEDVKQSSGASSASKLRSAGAAEAPPSASKLWSAGAAEVSSSVSPILASSLGLNRIKTRSGPLLQESFFGFNRDKVSTLGASNLSKPGDGVSSLSVSKVGLVEQKKIGSVENVGFGGWIDNGSNSDSVSSGSAPSRDQSPHMQSRSRFSNGESSSEADMASRKAVFAFAKDSKSRTSGEDASQDKGKRKQGFSSEMLPKKNKPREAGGPSLPFSRDVESGPAPRLVIPVPREVPAPKRTGLPFVPDWGLTVDDSALGSSEISKKIMLSSVPPVDTNYLLKMDLSFLCSYYFRLQKANEFGGFMAVAAEEKARECEDWAFKHANQEKSYEKLATYSALKDRQCDAAEEKIKKLEALLDRHRIEVEDGGFMAVAEFKASLSFRAEIEERIDAFKRSSEFEDLVNGQAGEFLNIGFENFRKEAAEAFPEHDYSSFVLKDDEETSEGKASEEPSEARGIDQAGST